ncbi:MAG: metallophosphoesterase [Parachlamydiales bacterium]|nr:metallophosphoesterase [Parachlamydiales bacterium]
MAVWVIGDLHLSFGVPGKKMDVFGPNWENHPERIAKFWKENVTDDDLVLLPGDISWAMKPEQALIDLQWIAALPGHKIMVRGNHDYWWSSFSKVQKVLPPSIQAVHHTAVTWNNYSICGTRLWDTSEYSFHDVIDFKPRPDKISKPPMSKEDFEKKVIEDQKIFDREISRLEIALQALDQKAEKRIVMTHYPPIGLDMKESQASKLMEKYHVDVCVFGHLHSVFPNKAPFGEKNGIKYYLTSCDYLDCKLLRIL